MSTVVEKQTEAAVNHHLKALLAKDIDGVMEDYVEDSVFIVYSDPEAMHGLAAIRAMFTQHLEAIAPEVLSSFKVHRLTVDGEIAYLVWSLGKEIPFASDTFVVRGGKIVAQTAVAYVPQGG